MDNNLKSPLLKRNNNNYVNNPLESSNFFQRLLFLWVLPILKKGNKEFLEQNMLYDLRKNDKSHIDYTKFKNIWDQKKKQKYPLFKTLYFGFKRNYLICSFLAFFVCVFSFSTPLLINVVITYVKSDTKTWQKGLYLLLATIGLKLFYSLFSTHQNFQFYYLGIKLENVLNMALFDKSLRFSMKNTKKYSVGELVNYMQVDSQKLRDLPFYLGGTLFLPLQIGFAIFLMYELIGTSFLAGLGTIFLTFIFNFIISRFFAKFQKKLMENKDKRMKLANELISGIRLLKINAWETFALEKVSDSRNNELSSLGKSLSSSVLLIFSLYLTPMLILASTFTMYILEGNDMEPGKVFTLVSIFIVVQNAIRSLPMAISFLIQSIISIKRIEKFLMEEEIENNYFKIENPANQDIKNALEINGNFYWDLEIKTEEKTTNNKKIKKIDDIESNLIKTNENGQYSSLNDLSLSIKKGSFNAIIGDIGSGKSSLFHALIGDMKSTTSSEIKLCGKISYVSQKSWIMNDTIRSNITFFSEYNHEKYIKVIKAACLEPDLEILPMGDQTMIGEKGVNLSGGQKARVNLARALYSESDIILLDDPLSAVDVHVGKNIVENAILGMMKGKTIILITHALNYIKFTDYVIVLENGKISLQGNYDDIKNNEIFDEVFHKIESHNNIQSNNEIKDEFYENNAEFLIKKEGNKDDNEDLSCKKEINNDDDNNFNVNFIEKNDFNSTIVPQSNFEEKTSEINLNVPNYDNIIMEEDRKRGALSKQIYLKYNEMQGGFLLAFLILLIMSGWITNQIATNVWLAEWCSGNSSDNMFYLKIYLILSLSYGFFSLFRAAFLCISSIKVSRKLHYLMMRSLFLAPLNEFFDRVPTGRILNRISKDLAIVDGDLPFSIGNFLVPCFNFLGDIAFCVYSTSFYVIFPIIIFLIGCFKLQRNYMKVNRELIRLESISRSPIVSFFSETLNGLSTIRAYKKEKDFFDKHANNMDENKKNTMIQSGMNLWFTQMLTVFSFIVNISALAFCIFLNTTTPNMAGLLLSYALSLDSDIFSMVNSMAMLEAKMISFERCYSYTEIPPESGFSNIPPILNTKLERKYFPKNKKEEKLEIIQWPNEGIIKFEKLSVKYRKNLDRVLKNITLSISAGEKIGVVGRTGAGKSTIINTLLRILESCEGKILIDNRDISKISLQELRSKITTILQDSQLFAGTLRYNFDFLNLYTDEEINNILEKISLKESFESRNGLNFMLSENGENLSVGERQLLCIGRALLKKSKIVLIDEATSNIDINTEKTIYKVIKNELKECTVLTIAHRLNTIIEADKILVLEKGEIAEFDKPTILLQEKNSKFYQLWMETLNEKKMH